MKTQFIYICEHCHTWFDSPCEAHEIECEKKSKKLNLRAKSEARFVLLKNILLGEEPDDPIGAKINGTLFLIATRLHLKAIRSIAGATELVSTSEKPTDRDTQLIKRANEILAT